MDNGGSGNGTSSRKSSIGGLNAANGSLELHDDAVFYVVRKTVANGHVLYEDTHISRTMVPDKSNKKRRSSSAKRDPSCNDLCTLTTVRHADDDGKIRAEFTIDSETEAGEREAKVRKASIQRQSYDVESMNRLISYHKPAEQEKSYMVKQIRAGTIERLVDSLVVVNANGEPQIDNLYANAFLATFRKFSTCKEVLEAILRRCVAVSSANSSDSERVIEGYTDVLHLWIKSYPEDFLLSASQTSGTSTNSSQAQSQLVAQNNLLAVLPNPHRRMSTQGNSNNNNQNTASELESRFSRVSSVQRPQLSSVMGTSSPLTTLVRADVLDTFAHFEHTSKYDKFLKFLRKIREWLVKILQETVDWLSANESVSTQHYTSRAAPAKVPPRIAPKPIFARERRDSTHQLVEAIISTTTSNPQQPTLAAVPVPPQPLRTSFSISSVSDTNLRQSVLGESNRLEVLSSANLTEKLLSFSPRRFADALTLIDAQLFRAVRLYECLASNWSQPMDVRARRAASVIKTISQFNKLVQLIQSSVLDDTNWSHRPPQTRANVISFWIDVAQNLRKLKNFSSLKATVTSLTSGSLYRLNHHWSLVSKERRDTLFELQKLISEDNNHVLTRELLQKEGAAKQAGDGNTTKEVDMSESQTSDKLQSSFGLSQFGTIPYLGLFLTDLIYIDAASSDYVDVDSFKNGQTNGSANPTTTQGKPSPHNTPSRQSGGTKRKLINFEKCRREFDVLARIKLLQSSTTLYLQNLKADAEFDWFYAQFYLPAATSLGGSNQDGKKESEVRTRRISAGAIVAGSAPIRLLTEDESYKMSLQIEKTVVHRSASSSNLPSTELPNPPASGTALVPFMNVTSALCSDAFRSRIDNEMASQVSPAPIFSRSISDSTRATPLRLVSIPLDGQDGEVRPASVTDKSTTPADTMPPKFGTLHRKAKSSDERTNLLRSLSTTFSVAAADRPEEATWRNVRVKIDLDHPSVNTAPAHPQTVRSVHQHQHHGNLSHTVGRLRSRSPAAFGTAGKSRQHQQPQPQVDQAACAVSFNSLRLNSNPNSNGKAGHAHEGRDLRRVAVILNQFQTTTQFVEYKTIQVLNSDRKAHVVRKILAKFNLDAEADTSDYLEFCASNFDLVQLLNDGSELLIGENTNVFYALKSEAVRDNGAAMQSSASPSASDYVLALRFK